MKVTGIIRIKFAFIKEFTNGGGVITYACEDEEATKKSRFNVKEFYKNDQYVIKEVDSVYQISGKLEKDIYLNQHTNQWVDNGLVVIIESEMQIS